MYISKFQVQNYKSYRDSGEVELKPGFNLLTGQNSAGKSALLEAMSLRFGASPTRNSRTIPARGASPPPESVVHITFIVKREELFHMMGSGQFYIPTPQRGFMIPGNGPYEPHQNASQLLRWLEQENEFALALRRHRNVNGGELWVPEGPVLGKYEPVRSDPNGVDMLGISTSNERFQYAGGVIRGHLQNYITNALAGSLVNRIYRFRAERFNVGRCRFGNNPVLHSDASNLPEAINTLNANPERFRQLNTLVREVLPQV